jgi:hypothetical protein
VGNHHPAIVPDALPPGARPYRVGDVLGEGGRGQPASGWSQLSVYIDHAFAAGDWGRWTGGGHLQADTLEELHAFAAELGLRREWFQSKPGRPENDHYDLTRAGRERAIARGAVPEDRRTGTRRRQAIRRARRGPLATGP